MNSIRTATNTDLMLLVLVAVIWASAFVAIKIAVVETGPVWLAAFRVIIGFAVLAPYVFWTGFALPQGVRQWRLVIIMSLLNIALPFFLISWAEQTIDAGVTSLLMGTGPFLALVGSHFLTHDDKITGRKLIAVVLGFSGVALIVGGDAFSQLGRDHTLAQLAALGGSLCYVIAGLIIRRIELPAAPLSLVALLISAVVLVPIATYTDGLPTGGYSTETMLALLFLGALPTGLAYILRFYLIRAVGYATFALSINLIPVIGIFLGVIILGETLRPQVLVALVLVVSGLFVVRGRLPFRKART